MKFLLNSSQIWPAALIAVILGCMWYLNGEQKQVSQLLSSSSSTLNVTEANTSTTPDAEANLRVQADEIKDNSEASGIQNILKKSESLVSDEKLALYSKFYSKVLHEFKAAKKQIDLAYNSDSDLKAVMGAKISTVSGFYSLISFSDSFSDPEFSQIMREMLQDSSFFVFVREQMDIKARTTPISFKFSSATTSNELIDIAKLVAEEFRPMHQKRVDAMNLDKAVEESIKTHAKTELISQLISKYMQDKNLLYSPVLDRYITRKQLNLLNQKHPIK